QMCSSLMTLHNSHRAVVIVIHIHIHIAFEILSKKLDMYISCRRVTYRSSPIPAGRLSIIRIRSPSRSTIFQANDY
ncbi:hypothetical protein KA005_82330, partial [bacterium]|nr:hypothetical protein [bacterium]